MGSTDYIWCLKTVRSFCCDTGPVIWDRTASQLGNCFSALQPKTPTYNHQWCYLPHRSLVVLQKPTSLLLFYCHIADRFAHMSTAGLMSLDYWMIWTGTIQCNSLQVWQKTSVCHTYNLIGFMALKDSSPLGNWNDRMIRILFLLTLLLYSPPLIGFFF